MRTQRRQVEQLHTVGEVDVFSRHVIHQAVGGVSLRLSHTEDGLPVGVENIRGTEKIHLHNALRRRGVTIRGITLGDQEDAAVGVVDSITDLVDTGILRGDIGTGEQVQVLSLRCAGVGINCQNTDDLGVSVQIALRAHRALDEGVEQVVVGVERHALEATVGAAIGVHRRKRVEGEPFHIRHVVGIVSVVNGAFGNVTLNEMTTLGIEEQDLRAVLIGDGIHGVATVDLSCRISSIRDQIDRLSIDTESIERCHLVLVEGAEFGVTHSHQLHGDVVGNTGLLSIQTGQTGGQTETAFHRTVGNHQLEGALFENHSSVIRQGVDGDRIHRVVKDLFTVERIIGIIKIAITDVIGLRTTVGDDHITVQTVFLVITDVEGTGDATGDGFTNINGAIAIGVRATDAAVVNAGISEVKFDVGQNGAAVHPVLEAGGPQINNFCLDQIDLSNGIGLLQ